MRDADKMTLIECPGTRARGRMFVLQPLKQVPINKLPFPRHASLAPQARKTEEGKLQDERLAQKIKGSSGVPLPSFTWKLQRRVRKPSAHMGTQTKDIRLQLPWFCLHSDVSAGRELHLAAPWRIKASQVSCRGSPRWETGGERLGRSRPKYPL